MWLIAWFVLKVIYILIYFFCCFSSAALDQFFYPTKETNINRQFNVIPNIQSVLFNWNTSTDTSCYNLGDGEFIGIVGQSQTTSFITADTSKNLHAFTLVGSSNV
jgi:hypothetical protein